MLRRSNCILVKKILSFTCFCPVFTGYALYTNIMPMSNLDLRLLFHYFSKGHTDDFAIMIENLSQKYSNSNIVACGFSLGGNLVTKYLGEKQRMKPSNVVGGISICQGYNAVEYV